MRPTQSNVSTSPPPVGWTSPGRARGFTMVELLVVIGLIALLVAILLPAIGAVRNQSLVTSSMSTMRSFAAAADTFQQEFGHYPGVVPEEILAATTSPPLSGTENALLHMMGGFIGPDDPQYDDPPGDDQYWTELDFANGYSIKVNLEEFGKGPVIGGKRYEPFYSPGDGELLAVRGQEFEVDLDPDSDGTQGMPDLVDAWGQPIIYIRRARSIGPLADTTSSQTPQFLLEGAAPYLASSGLGERGANQTNQNGNTNYSILTDTDPERINLMMLVANPAFRAGTSPDYVYTTPRGSVVLISPGKDGVYFGAEDGAGSPGDGVDEIPAPQVVGEYDDIVVVSGGS